MIVSVPLRGNGYETQGTSHFVNNGFKAFPSPCGEMGMKQDKLQLAGEFSDWFNGFPSPCGEMGMKLTSGWEEVAGNKETVSVPLRGNGHETSFSM